MFYLFYPFNEFVDWINDAISLVVDIDVSDVGAACTDVIPDEKYYFCDCILIAVKKIWNVYQNIYTKMK